MATSRTAVNVVTTSGSDVATATSDVPMNVVLIPALSDGTFAAVRGASVKLMDRVDIF